MPAKRCSGCGLNWPMSFNLCASCKGGVSAIENAEAMKLAEARSLANHFEFERRYGRDDDDHGTETVEERDARRARYAVEQGVGEATNP